MRKLEVNQMLVYRARLLHLLLPLQVYCLQHIAVIFAVNESLQLQSLEESGDAEAGSESDASVSSKDAVPAATPTGGAGGGMPPRTASMEEIAKKKQQNRLSGSGLRAPTTVGKSKRQLSFYWHLYFVVVCCCCCLCVFN